MATPAETVAHDKLAGLAKAQKRMIVVRMAGGLSQLESWDPKPNTDTGGPFRAIKTSVPGIHISELLPYTAKQMHNLCLVRGINTRNGDHGKGTYMMLTGRHRAPGMTYPELGAVVVVVVRYCAVRAEPKAGSVGRAGQGGVHVRSRRRYGVRSSTDLDLSLIHI